MENSLPSKIKGGILPKINPLLKRMLVALVRIKNKIKRPKFEPNYRRIELDITYDCNLKCLNCARSCRQAPSEDNMTIGQIKKFVEESRQQNRKWEWIRIIGGEPTLHPQIKEIIKILCDYKKRFSPETTITLVTNGSTKEFEKIQKEKPKELQIENSNKKGVVQEHFFDFNIAPMDVPEYRKADYSKACWVTDYCGIGLSKYGYYPCGQGAGIDRVLGFDIGRKKLPKSDDAMTDQLLVLCKYCGAFKYAEKMEIKPAKKEKISPAWAKAYERFKANKPKLTEYLKTVPKGTCKALLL